MCVLKGGLNLFAFPPSSASMPLIPEQHVDTEYYTRVGAHQLAVGLVRSITVVLGTRRALSTGRINTVRHEERKRKKK
jgi:hypothetical protein